MRLIGTRTNEQDVEVGFVGQRRNVAGQTGTSTEFLPNFSPAPEWQGNMFWTYSKAAFSFTAQARYTGKGLLNATTPYVDPTSPDWAQNAPPPTRVSTVWDNTLPSWTVWNLNMRYNFTGRGSFTRFEELSMFFSVENAGDKQPILSSGGAFSWGNVGGVNATFFDTLGRRFQVGMNMQF
jgi:iron complex outermembrane recepter protein